MAVLGRAARIACRNCGRGRHYKPSTLRRVKSYEPATGTYLCRACRHQRRRSETTCPVCRQPFSHPARTRRIYCSMACRSTSTLRLRPPASNFNAFIWQRWVQSGQTIRAYAMTIGVGENVLRTVLANRLPMRRNYDRLRQHFGDELPASPTDTDRRIRQARAAYANLYPKPGTAAFAANRDKAGETMRGRPKTRDHIDKMVAARQARESYPPADLVEFSRSAPGRAIHSLVAYLHRTPQPTEAQAREWAKACADRLGEPVETVLRAWKRTLRRRGIVLRVPPAPKQGRAWTVPDSKAGTIRQLYGDRWTRQQIIEEGRQRNLRGAGGWSANYVDQTLSKARRRDTLQS